MLTPIGTPELYLTLDELRFYAKMLGDLIVSHEISLAELGSA